jgi:hypothetical protein
MNMSSSEEVRRIRVMIAKVSHHHCKILRKDSEI